jgi:octaprenyl-diphosphate synthase
MVIAARRSPLPWQAPVIEDLSRVNAVISRLFDGTGGLVAEIGRLVLSSNGKRVRPTLLLLAARNGRPAGEAAILAAAVVELIHVASLIHDDSVDRSLLRRGKPTINSLYSDQVSVIMGDFVYTRVFAMMMERGLFEEMTILAVTAHAMSLGEMHQLERRNRLAMTEEECIEVIDEKTASLFAAACRIGAKLAGGIDHEQWAAFGRAYGRAFQITDDLFDFIGDEAVMGKARGSDIKGGRVTLPLVAALRTATPRETRRMEEVLADGVRDGQWDELVRFIERRGGVEYSFRQAARYADEARAIAERLPMDDETREAILAAVHHVVRRRR